MAQSAALRDVNFAAIDELITGDTTLELTEAHPIPAFRRLVSRSRRYQRVHVEFISTRPMMQDHRLLIHG